MAVKPAKRICASLHSASLLTALRHRDGAANGSKPSNTSIRPSAAPSQ